MDESGGLNTGRAYLSWDPADDAMRMWDTEISANGAKVSSEGAIDAARRFFREKNFGGLPRVEFTGFVEQHKRGETYYSGLPFYPIKKGQSFYRFENGRYGVQIDVSFDGKDRVKKVELKNIE